ncbi:MAG: hypothetical protein E6Y08_14740 [Paenibacillus sp.]|jgi:nucleoside-diphosphate-sugar epimerase|uniref:hypothetical protein n=1 Tax=Paenibacillus sp. TaxID=58172 RepID=UPI00290D5FBE|nr:hypothetical protein [Paenibacillus sp.]MDU4697068.1 hypothetical protein [Paenibacillus sp.]
MLGRHVVREFVERGYDVLNVDACRLAVEADGLGAVALNIAADDSSMAIRSRELMAARYPGVSDFRAPLEAHETLLSNEKTKQLLGWQPVHFWRDEVKL